MILGIDPGLSGALAWLDRRDDGGAPYWFLEVADMPTLTVTRADKNRREVAEDEIIALVRGRLGAPFAINGTRAYVEKVASMPGMGAPSVFSFGCQYGQLRMLLACCGIARSFVTPQAWKKAVGLKTGATKDESRRLACERFPTHAELFARKKDEGRAEAALIAYYGATAEGIRL
jgi:crossover junction endodeoxyribonuclease RuvC